MSFFVELKRRNVFRIGIAYVLMGWVLLQGADFVFDLIGSPNWVIQTLSAVVVLGLPIALFFAWAFEMTPEGIKREADVDRTESITPQTGRKLDRAIIVFLALALVLVLGERFFLAGNETVEPPPMPAGDTSAKSVAVLPFDDMSQARDQEWFADGLAEEILNALTRVPDLQVSSRTSSFRYRDSDLPMEQIAEELGVAHILEGSVRSAGDTIRVTAQLIRAQDGFHLWSETYDRNANDLMGIQQQLAVSIALALETSMDPEALEDMARVGTQSIDAYLAYLKGVSLLNTQSTRPYGDIRLEALPYFEQASDIDPEFAAAHFQQANWWYSELTPSFLFNDLTDLSVEEVMQRFESSINRAIDHAATPAERKGYLALKAQTEGRLRDAIPLWRDFLAERPNDWRAASALYRAAYMSGDLSQAEETLEMSIDRFESDLGANIGILGRAYEHMDPVEVVAMGEDRLERWPDNTGILYQTHRAMMWAGQAEAGAALLRRLPTSFPNLGMAKLRQACLEGRLADAEAIYAAEMRTRPDDAMYQWQMLKTLGRDQEASEALHPLTESPSPHQVAAALSYAYFDPTPHPEVMDLLEREGVLRPPTAEIPFKCPPPEDTSIAVLPFVNMSADADNEYFSDGVAEEILNVLADIPDLKVASRTSAFRYKGSNLGIAEIADELGVTHVLEGSVRKAGDQVRITAQLIQADDGFHMWSETYDRELTNIFTIQDEIASSIAKVLEVHLLGEKKPYSTAQDLSPESYEKFLKARYLMRRRNEVDMAEATRLSEEVLAEAPDFPRGLIQLAETLVQGPTRSTSTPQIEELTRTALTLDPELAGGYMMLGMIEQDADNPLGAIRHLQKAIELDPNEPRPHHWLGINYANIGYLEKGRVKLQTAVDLEPDHANANGYLGFVLLLSGDFDDAVRHFTEQVRLGNEFGSTRLVYVEVLKGDMEQARATLRKLDGVLPDDADRVKRYLDAYENPDLLDAYLDTLAAIPEYDWHVIFELYSLGQYEQVLDLQFGFDQIPRESWSDIFAEARSLPRFMEMVKIQNLDDVWDELGPPPACRKTADGYDCSIE
jgi:TolB-like protein/Tfp pilus assembly protein PilF